MAFSSCGFGRLQELAVRFPLMFLLGCVFLTRDGNKIIAKEGGVSGGTDDHLLQKSNSSCTGWKGLTAAIKGFVLHFKQLTSTMGVTWPDHSGITNSMPNVSELPQHSSVMEIQRWNGQQWDKHDFILYAEM